MVLIAILNTADLKSWASATGSQTVERVTALRPDVVLLDLSLKLICVEALRQLRQISNVRVIVFTASHQRILARYG
jgi:CheY-like chemotaxis protein